jgi:hypothetical protein
MLMLRPLTSIVSAAALLSVVLANSGVHAQANCEWYAKTALRQQQDNERMKCGFSGPAWSANLADHLRWCSSVAPDAWRIQAQKRDAQLAQCAKK